MLKPDEREQIERAVRQAEEATRAEFVCVISEEASDYSEVPLLWASALALMAPVLPVTFLAFMVQVREAFMGWIVGPAIDPTAPANAIAVYATLQCFAFVLMIIVMSIPAVRRALTPRSLKRRFVRERAFEQFIGKGLASTVERTGLLLFVSMKDKCAEVIADVGIASRVPPETWSRVVKILVARARRGRAAEGLVAAIELCGLELARQFPSTDNNPNEIPDTVTEIPLHSAAG